MTISSSKCMEFSTKNVVNSKKKKKKNVHKLKFPYNVDAGYGGYHEHHNIFIAYNCIRMNERTKDVVLYVCMCIYVCILFVIFAGVAIFMLNIFLRTKKSHIFYENDNCRKTLHLRVYYAPDTPLHLFG